MAELATADTGGQAALTAVDVHKSFGSLEVLKGVSLTAHSGDVIAMLGSSGSGKSTFLRCINLLEIPNSGEVRVGGELIEMTKNRRVETEYLFCSRWNYRNGAADPRGARTLFEDDRRNGPEVVGRVDRRTKHHGHPTGPNGAGARRQLPRRTRRLGNGAE